MTIEDTSKRDPIVHLGGALVEGSEDYIVGMEKAGGAQLREQANADVEWINLPADMRSTPRGDFEALGFEFHPDDVAILERAAAIDVWGNGTDGYGAQMDKVREIMGELSDSLFVRAKLPEGWKVEDGKHTYGYWNYIVDAEGYRRVSIFYKAAFYDRGAHMGIDRLSMTGAQSDAWEKIEPGHEGWRGGESRREGPNYVYQWRGRYGDDAPEGKHAYSDDGRRLEIEVAPDGTVVGRREFTAEPTACAFEMREQRRAFGYEYRRADYASERVRPLWERSAPWATGTMVVMASNMREAIVRDLGPRMPVSDSPSRGQGSSTGSET